MGSATVEMYGGLSQGSCLSPIIFNLNAAKWHEIQNDKTPIFQFADDFLIVYG